MAFSYLGTIEGTFKNIDKTVADLAKANPLWIFQIVSGGIRFSASLPDASSPTVNAIFNLARMQGHIATFTYKVVMRPNVNTCGLEKLLCCA